MSFKDWQTAIHTLAKRKGWHDRPRSDVELHMLMVTELAEATEAVRAGQPDLYQAGGKPEGQRSELADVVIRILDMYEAKGWDLESDIRMKHEFNKGRPWRHGGKLL